MKKLSFIYFILICSLLRSQVGIGTKTPNSSAILDLSSSNKGLMIPKVSLNAANSADYSFMAVKPTESLLIYNTNTAVDGGLGLYYWSGTKWIFAFTSENISKLLGITKYASKTYNTGISSATFTSAISSTTPEFVTGRNLSASPYWKEIIDGSPLTITIDRPKNNIVVTFTGMLQMDNTTTAGLLFTYGLGIFVDGKLISSRSSFFSPDNNCGYKEFTITGIADDLSVGNHIIQVAAMNRNGNNVAGFTANYGQKASACNTISNDEAKASALVLINQPLPY